MVTIAQLTDTHLDGSASATDKSARVMAYLRELAEPIAAIVVTGDVTDHGLPEEYEIAAEVLTASVPVLMCPGNHDERRAFARVLLRRDGGDLACGNVAPPIDQSLRLPGLMVLACDSSVVGQVGGALEPVTLAWLREQLSADRGTPVLLAMHHPPADIAIHGYPEGPADLADPADLAGILADFPEVLAVLSGHLHAAAHTTFAGRPLVVAAAVSSQVELPGKPGSLMGRRPRYDRASPPALTLHTLDSRGQLTTHTRVVP